MQDSSYNFDHVPLDTRHVIRKIRKSKKGGHRWDNLADSNRHGRRPTKFDMPDEWLEDAKIALSQRD